MKKIISLILLSLISVSAFSQWTTLTSGTINTLRSVHFPTANTGYAVGINIYTSYPGIILKTVDAGTTWTTLSNDSTYHLLSVFFTDSITGFVVGFMYDNYISGIIMKTIDGGVTWTNLLTLSNPEHSSLLNSVYFTDANTGYVVGEYGIILKTTNGGTLWTSETSGTSEDLNSVYFINADTGYTVGGQALNPYSSTVGAILKTNNGGTQWTETDFGNYFNSVYFTDANTGYAVGFYWWKLGSGVYEHGVVILKTTNGGTNWTMQNSGIPSQTNSGQNPHSLNSVYFTDANKGYIVGDSGIIIMTTNGGDYWARQNSGTTMDLYSVYFTDDSTGYAVGTNGTILKTTNGGGYPVGLTSLSSKSKTLMIYPNPSSDQVTIETSTIPIHRTLSIMNLNGQQLITHQITQPKTQIDITSLPSGVYFVRLTGERTVEVGKIIKE
jgi:photosystem II stability/assembly factor-like uncharacterized protein